MTQCEAGSINTGTELALLPKEVVRWAAASWRGCGGVMGMTCNSVHMLRSKNSLIQTF